MPPKKTAAPKKSKAASSTASQNRPVTGSYGGPTPARVAGVADHLYRRDADALAQYNQAVADQQARFRVEHAQSMGTATQQAEMDVFVERNTYAHTLARNKARGKVQSLYTRN